MGYDDKGGENASLEEKISKIASEYKIPIILGVVGTIFIVTSVLLLTKKSKSSGVQFVENESSVSAGASSSSIEADIQGAVINPGVYEMDLGSRVGDLIVLAGGLSSSADREWIAKNQAARLPDGAKLYIHSVGEPIVDSGNGADDILGISSDSVININSASESELDTLPGIGPVTSQKIIAGRPYQTIEELKERKIVGQATYEKIKDLIAVY